MKYSKVKHTRLYEQVLSQIDQQIKEGKLKLGDRLPPERELSKQMGVSRGTLRDAFRILEAQGVIETKPGGGRHLREIFNQDEIQDSESIIKEIQKATIMDLLEVREILEERMIELVCKRATKEEIDRLESLIEEESMNPNKKRNQELDYVFHTALAECTKNIVIINFMKLNLKIMNQTRKFSYKSDTNFNDAQKEHRTIYEAVKLRDVEQAKQAVKNHINNIKKRLKTADIIN